MQPFHTCFRLINLGNTRKGYRFCCGKWFKKGRDETYVFFKMTGSLIKLDADHATGDIAIRTSGLTHANTKPLSRGSRLSVASRLHL